MDLNLKRRLGKYFRCPFHTQGAKEKSLYEIALSEDRTRRIDELKSGFIHFYENPQTVSALLFTLPPSLQANCTSIKELKKKIIPYQCEMAAAQLMAIVFPYFPYDSLISIPHRTLFSVEEQRKAFFAEVMRKANKELVRRSITNALEFADMVQEVLLRVNVTVNDAGPGVRIYDQIAISIHGIDLRPENDNPETTKDPVKNKRCFTLVTGPYYPKEFGRYSGKIKLVITRVSDLAKVSDQKYKEIRRDNSEVLKQHGFSIPFPEAFTTPEGVWDPSAAPQLHFLD